MPSHPPTVAPQWHPRDEAWLRRSPSPYAGRLNRPLFVGGCPRSGTTLLRTMLDTHPDIAIPHETDFVRGLWKRRARWGDLSDEETRRAIGRWIFTQKRQRGYRLRDDKVGKKAAVRRVIAAEPTLGSIVEACFGVYAHAHAKPRWGDKRPSYFNLLRPLFAMFPDAQYINVVRDPRGAVASQTLMRWDAPDVAVPAAIVRWESAVRRTDAFARRLRPDQLLDVRYEDLVSDPHAEMARICAWAGLRGGETIDGMVSERDRPTFKARAFAGAGEAVTTTSVERWRERLSPEQARLVEEVTAPLRGRFGYRDSDFGAPPTEADRREISRQRWKVRKRRFRQEGGDLWRRATYRQPVRAAGH